MNALTAYVDVANLAAGAGPNGHFRRIAGLLADRETLVVATMVAGEAEADPEFQFTLADAVTLADACLSGDRRALTTPGLARILSAAVAVLFRVALANGAIHRHEVFDGRDIPADRGAANGDEDLH